MAMQKATIGTILIVAVMGVVVATALGGIVVTRTVTSTGSIQVVSPSPSVKIGVYANSACTTNVSSVSWGTLNPGGTTTSTIYLRNEGNVAVTLSAVAGNWNPSTAQNYLTLTWNQGGTLLQPNAVIQAVLTLTVSSSITGITTFSFDIIITATQ